MVTAAELRVVLTAENAKLKAALDDSSKRIDSFAAGVDRAGESTASFSDILDRSAGTISRTMNVLTRLDLVQITLEQSAERVRLAQEKYTEALAESGPASEQAVSAQQELTRAQAAAEKANLRARASYVVVAAEIVSMATQLPALIRSLNAYVVSAAAATAGTTAWSIALKATGIGAAIIAAAALADHLGLLGTRAAAQAPRIRELEDRLAALREREQNLLDIDFGDRLADLINPQRLQETRREIQELERELGGLIVTQEAAAEAARVKAQADEEAAFAANQVANAEREAEAATRARADAAEFAARQNAEAMAAWSAQVSSFQRALGIAGLGFEDFTRVALRDLFKLDGMIDAVEQSILDMSFQEDELLRSALDLNPALLDQVEVSRKKGETNEELAERLGLTTEQERELLEAGRLVEEGIISQEEAQRRLADTQTQAAESSTRLENLATVQAADFAAALTAASRPPAGGENGGGNIQVIIQRIDVPVTNVGETFDERRVANSLSVELGRQLRESLA